MAEADPSESKLLLEVLKISANGALAMASAAQNSGPGTTDKILDVLQATVEVALSIANNSRYAAATDNASKRPTTEPTGTKVPQVRIPTDKDGRARNLGDGPFVICERVGTVSLEAWKSLSEDRLDELDRVLKIISSKVCGVGLGWLITASTIQQELAAFGLEFATWEYFPTDTDDSHWKRSKNANLSDLDRIQAMDHHFRYESGNKWYADEMLRVAKRLMELRGFRI